MSRLRAAIAVIAVCVLGANVFGQGTPPFKLGTFDLNGRTFRSNVPSLKGGVP